VQQGWLFRSGCVDAGVCRTPDRAERLVHAALTDYRMRDDREFFRVDFIVASKIAQEAIAGACLEIRTCFLPDFSAAIMRSGYHFLLGLGSITTGWPLSKQAVFDGSIWNILFWTTADLENKLLDFRTYFNNHRTHDSLEGRTPDAPVSRPIANLRSIRWQPHCRALYQTPAAA
jgi:hypothetical protein